MEAEDKRLAAAILVAQLRLMLLAQLSDDEAPVATMYGRACCCGGLEVGCEEGSRVGTEVDHVAGVILAEVELPPAERAQLSPLVLAILVRLVTYLIVEYGPMLLEKLWNAIELDLCQRVALRRSIRACCPTPEDHRKYGQALYAGVLKAVPRLGVTQLRAVVREVQAAAPP